MDMDVEFDLGTVRRLVGVPAAWLQGAPASDRAENGVEPDADGAVAWCLQGAVTLVAGGDKRRYYAMLRRLSNAIGELSGYEEDRVDITSRVVAWNDAPSRTHRDVMSLLAAAIAA